MRYVPILRFRDSEKTILENVDISNKIVPLVEIVQDKRRSNMIATCFEDITNYLQKKDTRIFVDFPLYFKFKSKTKPGVLKFIQPILANPSLRLNHFDKLIGQNIIPVVSYNPNSPLYQSNYISQEFTHLRKSFTQIAIRIFLPHAQQALQEAEKYIQQDDIILVDLDNISHNDQILSSFYSLVINYAKKYKCKTVLIRSAIDPDTAYTKLTNNSIVPQLDNSLLTEFTKHGFDAFGDYCGLKKDELQDGGMPSPGCIFYHWWTNAYYGHKGVYKQADTFTSMVIPSLMSSNEWKDYQSKSNLAHINSCPGCKTIDQIYKTKKNGDSAPKWKTIIASHYLHTMEEFL